MLLRLNIAYITFETFFQLDCLSVSVSLLRSISLSSLGGVAVAQSVERETPCKEVPGSIHAVAARSILVGSCKYNVTG